ncbi:MAG: hypothetical protein GY830_03015 [Bacteroidetes bacterium]|nr:hypothetical protein [Bacteroidota bacterium]
MNNLIMNINTFICNKIILLNFKVTRVLLLILIIFGMLNCNLKSTKNMQSDSEEEESIGSNNETNLIKQNTLSTIEMTTFNSKNGIIDEKRDIDNEIINTLQENNKRKLSCCCKSNYKENKSKSCLKNCRIKYNKFRNRRLWLQYSENKIMNHSNCFTRSYCKLINCYDTISLKCCCLLCGIRICNRELCKSYDQTFSIMDDDEANFRRDKLLRNLFLIKFYAALFLKIIAFLLFYFFESIREYFLVVFLACVGYIVFQISCNLRHYFCPSIWKPKHDEININEENEYHIENIDHKELQIR